MDPLLDALERELEPVLDVPLAFFGHSLGAITAFEVARRLERRGCGPRQVLVSGHRAPHLRQTIPLVHLAPDDVIIGRMRRFGGTPELLYQQEDLLSALLPNLRADLALSETYRYTDPTPLRCALTAFGGTEDHIATEVTIESWEEVTAGRFRSPRGSRAVTSTGSRIRRPCWRRSGLISSVPSPSCGELVASRHRRRAPGIGTTGGHHRVEAHHRVGHG